MKKRVALLFGGKSPEHDISVWSFRLICRNIDKSKFDIQCIRIDRKGNWSLAKEDGSYVGDRKKPLEAFSFLQNIDIVFPIIHGPQGEDGTIQGFLEILQIPYVGADLLGSALCWDKDVCKRLLREKNLPVVPFICIKNMISYKEAREVLGKTMMIKPARSGSSLGMNKIDSEKDFYKALECAFVYDDKILLEKFIYGREFNCSILGKDLVSLPGEEIVHNHAFYSYSAKYEDPNGAHLEIPAKLTEKETQTIQELSVKSCQTLCCQAMVRVDFFMDKKGHIYINELNTIPGFTDISMYHRLIENKGITFQEMITKLIELESQKIQKSFCNTSRSS